MSIDIIHIVIAILFIIIGFVIGWISGSRHSELNRIKNVLRIKNPEMWDLLRSEVIESDERKIANTYKKKV